MKILHVYFFITLSLTPTDLFCGGNPAASAGSASAKDVTAEECPICFEEKELIPCQHCKKGICTKCRLTMPPNVLDSDPFQRKVLHCPLCQGEFNQGSFEKAQQDVNLGEIYYINGELQKAKSPLLCATKQTVNLVAKARAQAILGKMLYEEDESESDIHNARIYLEAAAQQKVDLYSQAMAQSLFGLMLLNEKNIKDAKTYLEAAKKQTVNFDAKYRAEEQLERIAKEEAALDQPQVPTNKCSQIRPSQQYPPAKHQRKE